MNTPMKRARAALNALAASPLDNAYSRGARRALAAEKPELELPITPDRKEQTTNMRLDTIIKNLCDTIAANPKATWAVSALAAMGSETPKYDEKRLEQRRRMGIEPETKQGTKLVYSAVDQARAFNKGRN
jgi:hypothetical protein